MTLKETLAKLKSLGNDTTFKHNKKWGASDNQFGCKAGDIRKLAAKIKTDDKLAAELWKTGNADAQLLAVLLMKPESYSAAELEKMVKSVNFASVADWLISYVLKEHPEKEQLRRKWMKASDKWLTRAGWGLTSSRVNKGAEGLDLPALLDRIEKEMGGANPAAQWTMNVCLAGIGGHFAEHRKRAIAIGEKLGVLRDYPVSKGCTSPFAPVWIDYLVKHKK